MNLREYRAAAHILSERHKKTPESALLSNVMHLLCRLPGVQAIRMNSGMANHSGRIVRYGYPGMADILVRRRRNKFEPWEVVWIELKARGGKQSDAQMAFQQHVEAWGDRYVLARSVNEVLTAMEVEHA